MLGHFTHLVSRWRDLFNVDFDVLLYDLTSTYFEINASDVAEGEKRRHGYSRDKRPDCPQVVIALVVTPDGLPLAYEVRSAPGRRGTARQHGGLHDAADVPLQRLPLRSAAEAGDRAAIRPRAACLGDGSRGSHRSGVGGNAQQ
jgi:hypothetical protein